MVGIEATAVKEAVRAEHQVRAGRADRGWSRERALDLRVGAGKRRTERFQSAPVEVGPIGVARDGLVRLVVTRPGPSGPSACRTTRRGSSRGTWRRGRTERRSRRRERSFRRRRSRRTGPAAASRRACEIGGTGHQDAPAPRDSRRRRTKGRRDRAPAAARRERLDERAPSLLPRRGPSPGSTARSPP